MHTFLELTPSFRAKSSVKLVLWDERLKFILQSSFYYPVKSKVFNCQGNISFKCLLLVVYSLESVSLTTCPSGTKWEC